MEEFSIDIYKVKEQAGEEEKAAQKLMELRKKLESQLNGIGALGTDFSYVKDYLKQVLNEVRTEEKQLKEYAGCLNDIAKAYENTEKKIVSREIAGKNAAEQKEKTDTRDEIEKAYEEGAIDKETYDILKSALSGL